MGILTILLQAANHSLYSDHERISLLSKNVEKARSPRFDTIIVKDTLADKSKQHSIPFVATD